MAALLRAGGISDMVLKTPFKASSKDRENLFLSHFTEKGSRNRHY